MARFVTRVEVPASTGQVWRRLTDWPAHSVPFTTVRMTGGRPDEAGATFVARTGIGPLGFDDPMEVVEASPPTAGGPGRCTVLKRGTFLRGGAWIEVRPVAAGTVVVWTEELRVAPERLTRVLDPLIALAGRLAFGRMLRGLLTGNHLAPGGHGA